MAGTIGAPIIAPAITLPDWAISSINLANPRLGAKALFASDDFFAEVSRMLNPDPAVFIPGQYDAHGKWMDGWESRRKRTEGHDYAIIKLGIRGHIRGFDVDTSHFVGNYPPAVAIEGCVCDSDDLRSLHEAVWHELLPAHALGPSAHHLIPTPASGEAVTHVRVHMYPDGGIARLRVYGLPSAAIESGKGVVDLIALENGGRPISWNDASFGSSATNLLLPGRGINMGDGWETRRRREPGNDWCVIQLGAPGVVEKIDIDTAHYKGNYPDRASVQGALMEGGTTTSITTQSMFWKTLLPEQKLQMDAVHSFVNEVVALGKISHIRFNIFPDGGVSRIRLWGRAG